MADRCPICADCICTIVPPRRRKPKRKAAKRTLSVSAKAYAVFQKAAEERGMSVRKLVEVACADV
jgi:hypothetical protein